MQSCQSLVPAHTASAPGLQEQQVGVQQGWWGAAFTESLPGREETGLSGSDSFKAGRPGPPYIVLCG